MTAIYMNKNDLKDCCKKPAPKEGNRGLFSGIIYGILPHTFCILFVIFSIIGATSGAAIFSKFFRIDHLFQVLVVISFVFATISAIIYLKRANLFSMEGIKRKKRYLTVLYSTTIIVNLMMIYLILPAAANLTNSNKISADISDTPNVTVESGVQVVNMTQMPGGYKPNQFTVKVGVPVKWVIDAKNPDTCSGSIIMRAENIRVNLVLGENVIEFTPKQTGELKFSCVMGMYAGKFTVIN